jgi:hypothetical protein
VGAGESRPDTEQPTERAANMLKRLTETQIESAAFIISTSLLCACMFLLSVLEG